MRWWQTRKDNKKHSCILKKITEEKRRKALEQEENRSGVQFLLIVNAAVNEDLE